MLLHIKFYCAKRNYFPPDCRVQPFFRGVIDGFGAYLLRNMIGIDNVHLNIMLQIFSYIKIDAHFP